MRWLQNKFKNIKNKSMLEVSDRVLGPGSIAKNIAKMLTSRSSCSESKEMDDIKENMFNTISDNPKG